MYIKMLDDKSLVITVPTTVYRGETGADVATFLLPIEYKGHLLSDCALFARYILPNGIGASEALQYLPNMHKNYLQMALPMTTKLTSQDGVVTVWITALDFDGGVVFKTGELPIYVNPSKDISTYLDLDGLDALDRLEAQVAELVATKADDVMFDATDSTLQLIARGNPIGSKIAIQSAISGVYVVDVSLNEANEIEISFSDGTTENLGKVSGDNAVYVPHVDNRKILTFTIEEAAGEIPDPVDLNPSDEWSDIDETEIFSDYVWEDM